MLFVALNAILGAAMGSFLNVVAERSVSGQRWWGAERSRCNACGKVLSAWELVPIASFLLQKGRCRGCDAFLGWRYLFVELIGAIFGGFSSWRFGVSWAWITALLSGYGLLLSSLTDIYGGYVYDSFVVAMGFLGIAFRVINGLDAAVDGLFGAALGGGVMGAIIVASRGKMGYGDATLSAGLGALLGWKMAALALYFGFLTGGGVALVLLALKKVGRKDPLPFVPFLAMGGVLALIFGPQLIVKLGYFPGWPWG
ncbi:prepilin peptidase [Acetomicrobium sp. S15 = DSM 107314]|uniref:prepilin peptidase n=1 Tax=Acetomicrobium sp. S15 = DSM 107314 TaxID=2529858 RepID=UPI0018E196BF|nr:A24 family peptidase [Acetomicrobium sp. S15 = DSM 107314]